MIIIGESPIGGHPPTQIAIRATLWMLVVLFVFSVPRAIDSLMRPTAAWPFLFALEAGDTHEVQSELKDGMDPEVCFDDGETALHFAKRKGYTDIVLLLRQAGAKQ